MKNYEKIYQELKKKYTDNEIAESMLIPADLSQKEQDEAYRELKESRMAMLKNMSEEDRIISDVMRLRFQIETYIKEGKFSFEQTFAKYLQEYIRILKKSRREIADDLSIHYTKLSRIINDKEEPNIELCYRLEKHAAKLIKAVSWWKLIIKKQEFIISQDEKTRNKEQEKVKNYLKAS